MKELGINESTCAFKQEEPAFCSLESFKNVIKSIAYKAKSGHIWYGWCGRPITIALLHKIRGNAQNSEKWIDSVSSQWPWHRYYHTLYLNSLLACVSWSGYPIAFFTLFSLFVCFFICLFLCLLGLPKGCWCGYVISLWSICAWLKACSCTEWNI